MALKKNSKSKRPEAERAAEHYAREVCHCVLTRRPVRTQWQSIDFFAADIVGKKKNGSHVYIQVTAGQASSVSARRKKLEKIPWHESDKVQLAQLVQTPNPANARKIDYFFRIHEYSGNPREWHIYEKAQPIPKEWFKAYVDQSKKK